MEKDFFNPKDYVFAGFYNAPPFNAWFWTGWYDPRLAKKIGLYIDWPGYICVGKGHIFAAKDVYERMEKFVRERLDTGDEIFFENLSKRIDEEAEEAFRWAKGLKSGDTSLSHAIQEIAERFHRITFYWAVGYFGGVAAEEIFRDAAEKHGIDPNKLSDYIGEPSTPLKIRQKELKALRHWLEEKQLLEKDRSALISEIKKDSELRAQFESHLAEYPWVGFMGFSGKPISLEKLLEEVLALKSGTTHSTKGTLRNPDFAQCVSAARHLLYTNQVGAEYFPIFAEKTVFILEAIAEQAGISREELLLLLPVEIFSGGELSPDLHELIERRRERKAIIFLGVDKKVEILDEPEKVKEMTDRFMNQSDSVSTETTIRGRVGNKGKAIGKVRVLLSSQDGEKMEPGEVLVTSMTTPDFVPLMQRASAIVTDLGGLLSHAVIMSRELHKPCIIGTKIATQALKDGDLVEVDAERGIVRILKRAEAI